MEYEMLASDDSVERTKQAAESRNIHTEYVSSKDDALKRVQNLIPAGAQVMTGGSETLQEIGFIDLLKSGNHPWNNLKDKIMAEKDEARMKSEGYSGSVIGKLLIVKFEIDPNRNLKLILVPEKLGF
ncbi:MAG TPA: LUD domain-containing protein [archaeon]|nr:LUD domain-containing protein [archaeon]